MKKLKIKLVCKRPESESDFDTWLSGLIALEQWSDIPPKKPSAKQFSQSPAQNWNFVKFATGNSLWGSGEATPPTLLINCAVRFTQQHKARLSALNGRLVSENVDGAKEIFDFLFSFVARRSYRRQWSSLHIAPSLLDTLTRKFRAVVLAIPWKCFECKHFSVAGLAPVATVSDVKHNILDTVRPRLPRLWAESHFEIVIFEFRFSRTLNKSLSHTGTEFYVLQSLEL